MKIKSQLFGKNFFDRYYPFVASFQNIVVKPFIIKQQEEHLKINLSVMCQ